MRAKYFSLDLRINEYSFGESGRYDLNITNSINDSCEIRITRDPVNANLPVLYSAIVYITLAIILGLAVLMKKRVFINRKQHGSSTSDLPLDLLDETSSGGSLIPSDIPVQTKPPRLQFLDTFRGICIVIMIFVNYGGGLYWYFAHSIWNGLTIADLVFPWFMFIMGTSMALSFESIAKKAMPKKEVYWKIVKRTVILFGLGVFVVNHNHDIRKFRVPGVLQRFAISYFVCAVLRSLTVVSSDYIKERQIRADGWRWYAAFFRDIWQYWTEWFIMFVILAVYLMITFLLPVEGCPRGYLGPGGLDYGAKYANCTGGVAGKIDHWFFGEKHIYQFYSFKYVYKSPAKLDPEGILGSLMSIFLVFLGLQAGQVLLVYDRFKDRIVRFLAWTVIYGLIAGLLCGFSKNEGWLPVNKNLWSPSFVFALASMGNFLILLLYYCIDHTNLWNGAPFYFVGMNSILLFLGHEVFQDYIPFSWKPVGNNHAAHLAMNLWGTSLWVVIAYYMHIKKFYISI